MPVVEFLPAYDIPTYGYRSHNFLPNELCDPTCTLKICSIYAPQENKTTKLKIEAIERVESFKELKDGWDGYNAKKINLKVIESAKDLIRKLPSCPEVFPTSSGSIQFQFEDSNENYLELEIQKNNIVEIYLEMADQAPEEFSVDVGDVNGWKKIEKLAKKFKEEISLKTNWIPMNSMQTKNYFVQFLYATQ